MGEGSNKTDLKNKSRIEAYQKDLVVIKQMYLSKFHDAEQYSLFI